MKTGTLFRISSIYLLLMGLGTLISPTTMLAGKFENTSIILVDTLRGISGALFGIAVIDWLARDTEACKARDAIVFGHIIGYAFATVFSIISLLHGYPWFGWVLIVLNAALTIVFLIAGLGRMRTVSTTS
jgi:hypothetical protein